MLRCSVVVGKKVDKKAVIRNKVKRMLVSRIKELLPETTPYDMVIYARRGAAELSAEQIGEETKNALNAVRILEK